MSKFIEKTQDDYFVCYPSLSALDGDAVSNFENNIDEWKDVKGQRDAYDWLGVPSYGDVVEATKKGWKEGREKAENAIKEINMPRLPQLKRRKKRGDFGDFIDMQKVYAGSLDRAWERTERDVSLSSSSSHVTVEVDIGVSARTEQDEAFWVGATASRAIDALQQSGRSVKVVAKWSVGNWKQNSSDSPRTPNRAHFSVVVKDYFDPMTIDKLFAMTALVGFFRVYGFKSILCLPAEVNGGLGQPIEAKTPPSIGSKGAFLTFDGSIRSKDDAKEFLDNLEDKVSWREK